MADETARLTIAGAARPIELPVLHGTVGPDVIDIAQLSAAGLFTYDPGFVSTASCESAITYIDGDGGMSLHRGYPIEQLAEHSTIWKCVICWLLTANCQTQRRRLTSYITITNHTMVHEQLRRLFDAVPPRCTPDGDACGVTGALSAFYHDSPDIDNPAHRKITAHR
jgi:citrate synthase